MTEIRTTSSTGGQKGVKPERFSLMPRNGLAWISRVFGFGAEKYDAHNWRKGYEWSKSFDALERHFQAAKDGETYDPESGLPHLAHAGFHILVLLTWLDEQGEGVDNPFDDRWPAAMARMRLLLEAEEHCEEDHEHSIDCAPSRRQRVAPGWVAAYDEAHTLPREELFDRIFGQHQRQPCSIRPVFPQDLRD